jgi:hypothetical protein
VRSVVGDPTRSFVTPAFGGQCGKGKTALGLAFHAPGVGRSDRIHPGGGAAFAVTITRFPTPSSDIF